MRVVYYKDETISSAGGVLVNAESKKVYLILKEASKEWLLPKGHIENDETIEQTAQREIYEETGYKNTVRNLLSVQVRPDIKDPLKTKVIFWFLSLLADSVKMDGTQMENENYSGKWFSQKEAIVELKWEEDKKLIEKVFEVF